MRQDSLTPVRKDRSRFTETAHGDEIVLMQLDTGTFYSLSGTGAATWRLIDEKRSRNELIAALQAEFDAESEEIATGVDEFLVRMAGIGFLVRR